MSSQVCQSVIQGKADIGFCSKNPPRSPAGLRGHPAPGHGGRRPLDHPLARQDTVTLEETPPLPPRDLFLAQRTARPGRPPFAPSGPQAYRLPGEDANFIFGAGAQALASALLTPPACPPPGCKGPPLTTRCRRATSIVRRSAPTPWAAWSGSSISAWRNPRGNRTSSLTLSFSQKQPFGKSSKRLLSRFSFRKGAVRHSGLRRQFRVVEAS